MVSQLVIQAFKSKSIVTWDLKNRWDNCIGIIRGLNFCTSHVYREGNVCADSMANFGLSLSSFDLFWFDIIPDIRNRLGMANFRFSTF